MVDFTPVRCPLVSIKNRLLHMMMMANYTVDGGYMEYGEVPWILNLIEKTGLNPKTVPTTADNSKASWIVEWKYETDIPNRCEVVTLHCTPDSFPVQISNQMQFVGYRNRNELSHSNSFSFTYCFGRLF